MSDLFPGSLFNGLYFPGDWPTFVNQQVYPALVAILTAGRAHNFADPYILPKNPVGSLPEIPSDVPTSSSTDAIAGADGALSNGVSMKKVFQDLVRTTRNRTPTCMSLTLVTFEDLWINRQLQLVLYGPLCKRYTPFHSPVHSLRWWIYIRATTPKWPVRSVETLPTFTRKTLSNRVLVIGNSVSLLNSSRTQRWLIHLTMVDRPHHTTEEREVYHPTTREQERGVG